MADSVLSQDIIVARIQNRRGRRVNLPQPLQPGELGWCTDTKQLFIGVADADATGGVELYRGVSLASQDLVNQALTTKLFSFYSSQTTLTDAELTALNALSTVPALYYVSDTNKSVISDYERQVDIIRSVQTSVAQSVTTGQSYTLMYDWNYDDVTSKYTFTFYLGSAQDNLFDLPTIAANSYIVDASVKSMYNSGYVMSGGRIFAETTRRSAALGVLINEYTDNDSTSYVTTKQNVEIITEYYKVEDFVDTVVNYPTTFELVPSATFTPVVTIPVSSGGNFETSPLVYDVGGSDVFNLDYSVAFADMDPQVMGNELRFVQSGTLTMVASTEARQVTLDDKSVDLRSSVSWNNEIDFTAVLTTDNKVQVQYRHNFASRVILKVTGKRWVSWDNTTVLDLLPPNP